MLWSPATFPSTTFHCISETESLRIAQVAWFPIHNRFAVPPERFPMKSITLQPTERAPEESPGSGSKTGTQNGTLVRSVKWTHGRKPALFFLCGGFLPHTIDEPGTLRAPQAGSSICRPWPARPSVCKRAPAEAGAKPSRALQIGWQRHFGRGVTPQSGKTPGILPVSLRQKRRIREIPY